MRKLFITAMMMSCLTAIGQTLNCKFSVPENLRLIESKVDGANIRKSPNAQAPTLQYSRREVECTYSNEFLWSDEAKMRKPIRGEERGPVRLSKGDVQILIGEEGDFYKFLFTGTGAFYAFMPAYISKSVANETALEKFSSADDITSQTTFRVNVFKSGPFKDIVIFQEEDEMDEPPHLLVGKIVDGVVMLSHSHIATAYFNDRLERTKITIDNKASIYGPMVVVNYGKSVSDGSEFPHGIRGLDFAKLTESEAAEILKALKVDEDPEYMYILAKNRDALLELPLDVVKRRTITNTINYKMPEPDRVYDVVDQLPQFPGGQSELLKYLAVNTKYPKSAVISKTQGQVIVTFVVAKDGSIRDVMVKKGINPEFDREALRVVRYMPKWIPGKRSGETVAVKYTLPISFRLP